MDVLLIQLLNMSFTASYVAIIVLLVRLFIRKMPKIYSYFLWGLVLFRMICPFTLESSLSLLKVNPIPIAQEIVYKDVPTIETEIPVVDQYVNGILEEKLPAPAIGVSINPIQVLLAIGALVWLIGVGVFASYTLVTWIKLKRQLSTAVKVGEQVFESEKVDTPFILGVIKPIIYLPIGLEEHTKRYVLAHEAYHLRRKDYIIKMIFYIALIVHWFNPMMWLSFYFMTKDMEMSCDEGVIKEGGIGEKKAYSKSLLQVAVKASYFNTPLAFGENHVKGRIKNILAYRKPAVYITLLIIVSGIAIGIGLLTSPKREVAPVRLDIDSVYVYDHENPIYANQMQKPNWFYEIDRNTKAQIYEVFEAVRWEGAPDNVRYDFMPDMKLVHGVKGGYTICNNIENKMYMEAFEPGEPVKRYFAPMQTYEDILSILNKQVKMQYDDAYVGMWNEENYIADLVGEMSGQDTSVENWRYNLQYLKEHYNEIIRSKDVNKGYVDSYIEAYTAVLKYIDEEPSKESTRQEDVQNEEGYKQLLKIDAKTIELIETNLEFMVNDKLLTIENARDEKAYQDILKQGENALEYLLSQFEGRDQDNKKGYIMMFLCQELLEERNNVKDVSLTPNEWYSALRKRKQEQVGDYIYKGNDKVLKLVYDHELQRTRNGDGFTVIAPEIIETVQEGNKLKVFFMSFSLTFALYETELYDKAGSITSGALTYTVNEDRTYTLDKAEYPQDGSYYSSSIKVFCVSPLGGKEIKGLADKLIYSGNESIHQLMLHTIKEHMQEQGIEGVKWHKAGGEVVSIT